MRIKGWERRFIDLVEFELSRPFDWTRANCGHVICCAIRACHGDDHPILRLTELLSQTKEGAESVGVSRILGDHLEYVPPALAQQADIGVLRIPSREIGCVILDGQAVGKREKGVFRINPIHLVSAYKV